MERNRVLAITIIITRSLSTVLVYNAIYMTIERLCTLASQWAGASIARHQLEGQKHCQSLETRCWLSICQALWGCGQMYICTDDTKII